MSAAALRYTEGGLRADPQAAAAMSSRPPLAFRCFECGAALGGHHWRVCTVCGRMFCRRHLIIETDTAICAACKARTEPPDAARRP